jgi:hypothetical protein
VLNKVYVSTFGRGIWATDLNVIASLKDTKEEIEADLYPTINNGSFTIDLKGENVKLEIVDICGRRVYIETLKGHQKHDVMLVLSSGKYFAKLTSDKGSGVKSFLVE